jgi:hypothetical protein
LLLFRHTPEGLRKIDTDNNPFAAPRAPLLVHVWANSLREVAPGEEIDSTSILPRKHRAKMVEGEKYELLWPGGEISIWDWGTKKDHWGQGLNVKSPNICLPAVRATLEFDKFSPAVERQSSLPPIAESERMQVFSFPLQHAK